MNFASNFAFINQKGRPKKEEPFHKEAIIPNYPDIDDEEDLNLNVFIVTFEGVKKA